MKTRFGGLILSVAAIVLAVYSARQGRELKLAADFPRGALVYVQTENLPELIKKLQSSKISENFLKSSTLENFKNRRLGLKLKNRWEEFGTASRFPIDSEMLATLSDKRAALALYDVGKLDFVLIAPVSEEVFKLTKFAQNRANFTEQIFDDGTIIYRVGVEADYGRQKQELIFCHLKNRFVLTTSEILMAQTLKNINDSESMNSLFDEADFSSLSKESHTDLLSVWVNQTALSEDYYFKRYWLMGEAEKLENIRAGLFEFSIESGNLIERRSFLLDKTPALKSISNESFAELKSFVPEKEAFYKIQAADENALNQTIEKTLFKPLPNINSPKKREISFAAFDDFSDYGSFNGDFEKQIDEREEFAIVNEVETKQTNFAVFLKSAKPLSLLEFTNVENLPIPLFFRFNRVAAFNLADALRIETEEFEAAIARHFLQRLSVKNAAIEITWKTKSAENIEWRELDFPMLEQKAVYAVVGNNLILSNNSSSLISAIKGKHPVETTDAKNATRYAVLNLREREKAFDDIFNQLNREKASESFFHENIPDLLNLFADFEKIALQESFSEGFLRQTVILSF